ncbi:hypothetical protein Droror1_Dr00025268 [Drosera rotundifolia]
MRLPRNGTVRIVDGIHNTLSMKPGSIFQQTQFKPIRDGEFEGVRDGVLAQRGSSRLGESVEGLDPDIFQRGEIGRWSVERRVEERRGREQREREVRLKKMGLGGNGFSIV